MTGKVLGVELFFAAGCSRCAEARGLLREAAQDMPQVEWKEIDVAKEPHRAVDAGVVSTPAVAIDGDLVFTTMPSARDLRAALQARLSKG